MRRRPRQRQPETVLRELKRLRPQINKAVRLQKRLFQRQNKLYLEAYQAGATIRQIAAAVGMPDQYEAVRQAIRKMEKAGAKK